MIKFLSIGMGILPLITLAAQPFEKEWSGLYLGGHVGGIINQAQLEANHSALSSWSGVCDQAAPFSSAVLGGQLGLQKQSAQKIVLGLEANYSYHFNPTSNAQCVCDLDTSVYDHFNLKNSFQTSVQGRIGYAHHDNLQPFVSAGVSFANLGLAYNNEASNVYSRTIMQPGYVVGGGLDWAYSERWNVRVEYDYNRYHVLDLNIPNVYDVFDSSGHGRLNLSSHYLRAVLNYWF